MKGARTKSRWVVLSVMLTCTVVASAQWDYGPGQLGNYWFASSGGIVYLSPNAGMEPRTEARVFDMAGTPYVQWRDGDQDFSWTMSSLLDRIGTGTGDGDTNGDTNGGTSDPDPVDGGDNDDNGNDNAPVDRPRVRVTPTVTGPSPEDLYRVWITGEQQAYVAVRELDRAQITVEEANQIMQKTREKIAQDEKDEEKPVVPKVASYSPPGEALRSWRYGVSASGRYGESRQRMPLTGTETTVRTRGVEVSGVLSRGRTAVVTSGYVDEVTASGIFSPLDHEVAGVRSVALYRAVSQETGALDVDLVGSLSLSRVRYEKEIPDVTRDTSYLAPGAGVAAGGWLDGVGHLRAVYYYAPTYALGSNRRQVTGRREVQVHSAGLSYAAPLYWDTRGAVWMSLSGLYLYTPDLPEGNDSDAVNLSGELAYRRERWAVSALVDHTAANDLEGRNWNVRLIVHRNF